MCYRVLVIHLLCAYVECYLQSPRNRDRETLVVLAFGKAALEALKGYYDVFMINLYSRIAVFRAGECSILSMAITAFMSSNINHHKHNHGRRECFTHINFCYRRQRTD